MKTERILLRLIKNKDFQSIIPLLNKQITRWINPIPYPPKNKDISEWLKFMSKPNKKTFVIIEKDKYLSIGMIWLENITNKEGEIGFWIGKKFQGKGYMKKAGNLILKYSKNNLGLVKINGLTVNNNFASQKTLESLGFKLSKTIKKDFKDKLGKWCDVLVYEKLLVSNYPVPGNHSFLTT